MQNALKYGETPNSADFAAGVTREQRDSQRYTLLIRAAKLISEAGEFLCVIRDASETGISARLFHPLPEPAFMTVELQNGDRHAVELIWQEKDRAGFRFMEAADIGRIIESPSRFAKRAIRLNVAAPAQVETSDGRIEMVEFTDLSQQGAKITCSCRFALDERVKVSARGLPPTLAKVRWRKQGSCGLIFENTYQYGEFARIAAELQGTA
ncbi:PilZ domain-containing protein [Aurantiacibacter hainanensis]|uniref:PilZ domain-containing protein n=1 Tax=Aurantiacibacter hainanensis TaxID=3076114 RepID=UPI0030C744E4